MPNNQQFSEGLTPDQFPTLSVYDDSSVIWVVLNNTDYSITLGALKVLLAENLPDPVLPEDVVRASDLTAALESKADTSTLEGLVTQEQLQQAIDGIAPVDIEAAITAYFETNSVPLPEGVLTEESLPANATITAIQESLDGKASQQSVTGLQEALTLGLASKANVEDLEQGLAGKANTSDVEGLVNTQQLEDAISAKANTSDLAGLASVSYVDESLSGKANASDLAGLVTADALADAVAGKADASALEGLATTQALTEGLAGKLDSSAAEGFVSNEALTEALSGKADSSALEGLASETWTTEQLSGKADTSALAALATKEELETLDTGVHLPENAVLKGVLTVGPDQTVVAQKLNDGRTYHVVGDNTHPDPDGSLLAPFKTIQDAVDAVPSNQSNAVIVIHPSVAGGDYAGFTVNDRTNLFIVGEGNVDFHPVKMTGTITITGNTTRIRVKNLAIAANVNTETQLIITGTQGRHYFENVTIEPRANYTGDVVQIDNLTNWVDFVNCNIGGRVVLGGEPSANALVAFRNANHPKLDLKVVGDYLVRMHEITRIGRISREQGRVFLSNVRGFYSVEGKAIVSSGDVAGVLSMDLVSLRQEDGSYATMDLQVGSTYRYGTNDFGVSIGGLPLGQNVDVGTTSHISYVPENYTPAGSSLDDHLRAIDAALGLLTHVPD